MQSFEEWVKVNSWNLSDDAEGLFMDSLRCYNNDIIRPAYLLAYQGMMLTIKERIQKSTSAPRGFTLAEWTDRKARLNHDHEWDERTYDCIVQEARADGSKDAIINTTQEIRRTFEQWRHLRNVCAHYKEYHFIRAHVQTLYSFIQQYLMTFSVEGGMMMLLNEMDVYYDPSKTPSNAPLKPLLDKIHVMVRDAELTEFYTELFKKIRHYDSTRFYELASTIIKEYPDIKEPLIDILIERNGLPIFLQRHPELIGDMLKTKEQIRSYWYSELTFVTNPAEQLAYLITSGKIQDKDEQEEAIIRIQSQELEGNKPLMTNSEIGMELLRSIGYFDIFVKKWLSPDYTSRNYKKINYCLSFYLPRIREAGISELLVKNIVEAFNNHPPYALQNSYRATLFSNEDYAAKFEEVRRNLGLDELKL